MGERVAFSIDLSGSTWVTRSGPTCESLGSLYLCQHAAFANSCRARPTGALVCFVSPVHCALSGGELHWRGILKPVDVSQCRFSQCCASVSAATFTDARQIRSCSKKKK